MTIVKKYWANNYFSSYESCSVSINLFLQSFTIIRLMKSSVTPVFRSQQHNNEVLVNFCFSICDGWFLR